MYYWSGEPCHFFALSHLTRCKQAALAYTEARTTFSGAFKTGALFKISKPSLLFNIFMNIALYFIYTAICFFSARPPAFLADWINPLLAESKVAGRLPRMLRRALTIRRMPREQMIAVCFCGAAKTTSLGIPLVTAMWNASDDLTRAFIQIPVLLYTIEQVWCWTFSFLFPITSPGFYMREGCEESRLLTFARFSWRRFLFIFSSGI